MASERSPSGERAPRGMCGICLSSFPKDEMRERGGDNLCRPCYEMVEKKSGAKSASPPAAAQPSQTEAPAPEPTATPSLAPKEEEKLLRQLTWLQQTVQANPDDVSTLVEMVEVYEKLGQDPQAFACRQQLSRVDPGHPILRKEAPDRRDPGAGEETPPAEPVVPFWMDVPGFLTYPFRGRGRAMLLVGGICFGLGMWIAVKSIWGIPLAVMVIGYLISYLFRVINSATTGAKEPPDWPEFTDFWDAFITPIIAYAILGFMTFGPYILLGWTAQTPTIAVLRQLAFLWGILAFPMVLLVFAMFHSIREAMNPGLVLSSIKRVLPDYLILAVILCILYVGHSFASGLLAGASDLVGTLSFQLGLLVYHMGDSFLKLYLYMTAGFLIGSIYHQGQGRLGWFEKATEPPRPLSPAVVRALAGTVALVLVVGLAKVFIGGGFVSSLQPLPLRDGLHLDYRVRYAPPGGGLREYKVRYDFAEVPEGFRVTGKSSRESGFFTEFTIDSRGNFVGEPPEREDPFPADIERGPGRAERTQSILWGPTGVDRGDRYRNGLRIEQKRDWHTFRCFEVKDPYLNGRLYYETKLGCLAGIDISEEGEDITFCELLLSTNAFDR